MRLAAILLFVSLSFGQTPTPARNIPRTPDGKPDFQGIWKVRDGRIAADLLQEKGVVDVGAIPYLPAAAKQKQANFAGRKKLDPLESCFMPGVPRIMYLDYPFHIFQTRDHLAMTFEWSSVHRLVYLNGKPGPTGIEFWMGDSRGKWEGDTLVVTVSDHNDKTWFDATGHFHSEDLRVVERYTMIDADTIRYEATMTDPKTFSKPWKITLPFQRQKDKRRILEFQCQAEKEEANGDFERDPRTWYPKK